MTEFVHIVGSVRETLLRRYAGPDNPRLACANCDASATNMYRCRECWVRPKLCSACMVETHNNNALHVVEEWSVSEGFWKRTTLANLGMVIRLGHGGSSCPRSVGDPREVCVITLHGLQDVKMRFCGCTGNRGTLQSEYAQLLEVGLWPGSWKLVRTAFTLEVLDHFRRLTTQGNVTAQDFIQCLVRQTDGVLPHTVKASPGTLVHTVANFFHIFRIAIENFSPLLVNINTLRCAFVRQCCPRKQCSTVA
jgi:hypothetical protein